MHDLIGEPARLGWVALKAVLLYLTAVFGFRLSERRTLAEMSAFDFVAAVAVGAIVGRVPNADTSYLAGAATLIAVLVSHSVVARLRRFPRASRLFDHPPKLLVSQGKVLVSELHRAGLTTDDLHGLLRQHGIFELTDVYAVIFEQRGKLSVIQKSQVKEVEPQLLRQIRMDFET